MKDLFDLMHSSTVLQIFSIWLMLMAGIFLLTYFLEEKNKFFKSIADFFIAFSFIKRTKNILLSYAVLSALIGLIGLFISSTQ